MGDMGPLGISQAAPISGSSGDLAPNCWLMRLWARMAHCWRLSPPPAPPIIPSHPVRGRLGAAPVSRLVIISVKVLHKYYYQERFKDLDTGWYLIETLN